MTIQPVERRAEAGTCNKAFCRYSAGKDDPVFAVMERGFRGRGG